jgi:hypothetical protein
MQPDVDRPAPNPDPLIFRLPDEQSECADRSYEVSVVDATDFEAMETPWRQLFADCSYPTPFASWEWVSNWWTFFSADGQTNESPLHFLLFEVWCGQHDNRMRVGLFPCYYRKAEPGNLCCLRLLGDMGGTTDDITEEPIVLLRKGWESTATDLFLKFVQTASNVAWDYVSLRMPCAQPPVRRPMLSLPGQALFVKREPFYTEVLTLPSSWEQFRTSLSKSMRDNLAYYPRRLTRHGHPFTVRIAAEPEDVEQATELLAELHSRRASSTRGIAHCDHLHSPLHRAFLKTCLGQMARRGMASVLLLDIDGVAAAALVVLHSHGVSTLYYTGFDPAYYDFSPLLILNAEAIRRAIEAGDRQINFLPGTRRWNARWGAVSEPFFERILLSHRSPGSLWRVIMTTVNRLQNERNSQGK